MNLQQYITPENAQDYANTINKIALCSDITGLSVSNPNLELFENELEALAIQLGYMVE